MTIAPGTDDTPSVSATTQSPDPPPAKSQTHTMEMDDEHGDPPPTSPVSLVDDDLLNSGGAVDIEGDLANPTVSSPQNPEGGGVDASIEEAPTCLSLCEAFPESASQTSSGGE